MQATVSRRRQSPRDRQASAAVKIQVHGRRHGPGSYTRSDLCSALQSRVACHYSRPVPPSSWQMARTKPPMRMQSSTADSALHVFPTAGGRSVESLPLSFRGINLVAGGSTFLLTHSSNASRVARITGCQSKTATGSFGQAEKKAAFSCLHKACELRRWQRRVDVPERALVLDLTCGEDEPAHGGPIE
jgi:hypothetical protein